MRSEVAELLADAGAGLGEIGARWYLFGARAAILYGAARLTADVDITVRLPDGTTSGTLVDALHRHRFRLRIAGRGFVERTRVLPFVHEATGLPLDLALAARVSRIDSSSALNCARWTGCRCRSPPRRT